MHSCISPATELESRSAARAHEGTNVSARAESVIEDRAGHDETKKCHSHGLWIAWNDLLV
jgi:hypothetical protein